MNAFLQGGRPGLCSRNIPQANPDRAPRGYWSRTVLAAGCALVYLLPGAPARAELILDQPRIDSGGLILSWLSHPGANYTVERSTSLLDHPAFAPCAGTIPATADLRTAWTASPPLSAAACYRVVEASTNPFVDPRIGFTYPDPTNYSALSWTGAFQAAHAKFSREYAFSDWKSVDWPGLSNRFLPRIAQAQAAGDATAYYLALHEYICAIPDRHISLGAADDAVPTALGKSLAGGGFGMAVAELDDGRVIAGAVVTNGPADLAGIVAGAEISTWGGVPAGTAIGQIEVGAIPFNALSGTLGNEKPQATAERYRLEQARLLPRGPVGANVQVVFRNPGAPASQSATLTAIDDAGQSFALLNFAPQAEFTDQVDYRILPEGYGYVRVRMERDMSNPDDYPTRVYQQFQQAIGAFVTAGVAGVIVDLRGNFGGSDQLAADLCGFFYAASSFYEYQEYFDKRNGQFLRITVGDGGVVVDRITIEPQTPRYSGPVVALVNPSTHSSGEGPAMGIARLPQGRAIGFHGTGGSFGMVGGSIRMPGGYTIEYPYGRTVDQIGGIQLDSRNGIGGVAPNPRVPKTLTNVLAFAAGIDVELQFAVSYLGGN